MSPVDVADSYNFPEPVVLVGVDDAPAANSDQTDQWTTIFRSVGESILTPWNEWSSQGRGSRPDELTTI